MSSESTTSAMRMFCSLDGGPHDLGERAGDDPPVELFDALRRDDRRGLAVAEGSQLRGEERADPGLVAWRESIADLVLQHEARQRSVRSERERGPPDVHRLEDLRGV